MVGLGWAIKRFKIKKLIFGTFLLSIVGLVFLFLKFLVLDKFISTLQERGYQADINSRNSRKLDSKGIVGFLTS